MHISVAPTNLFPLGEQPTRVSVGINRDLLKVIDPSMVPLEEGDSFTRVARTGQAAINQMTRDVSSALFGHGAEVTKLNMEFGWSEAGIGLHGLQMIAHSYMGICFDHRVPRDDPNPRVVELTAEEEIDGNIVFNVVEVDKARKDTINSCIVNAQRWKRAEGA